MTTSDIAQPSAAARSAGNVAAVRDRLTRTGRAQVLDFLDVDYARRLQTAALEADYSVVTRRGTGHVDLPSTWLSSLDPAQKQGLGEAIQASAQRDFQYLYDNHPINDLAETGQAMPIWDELVAFLNGEPFLGLMRDLTGEPRIALADAQLTRFRRGHFLTTHHDHAEGKDRLFAYVLGLTESWSVDWGGLLAFHGEDGNVAEAFTPRFNSLNLLKVPSPHSVTQVALNAGADRLSVTGWLRGR